jgi:hypothetical protein
MTEQGPSSAESITHFHIRLLPLRQVKVKKEGIYRENVMGSKEQTRILLNVTVNEPDSNRDNGFGLLRWNIIPLSSRVGYLVWTSPRTLNGRYTWNWDLLKKIRHLEKII